MNKQSSLNCFVELKADCENVNFSIIADMIKLWVLCLCVHTSHPSDSFLQVYPSGELYHVQQLSFLMKEELWMKREVGGPHWNVLVMVHLRILRRLG
jgi:hypothetical protein